MTHRLLICVLAVVVFTQSDSHADVRLPGFFNDHMVVQQQAKVKVWGWADKDEAVEVTFGGESATVKATADGRWQVELPAMTASSESHTLTVKGTNTITISDVLVGEVWLCSGQSNMEWSVRASTNAAEEIAAAQYPLIRHVKMPRAPSNTAKVNIDAKWQVCSPETAGNFTACGYFMARHLHNELNVPIGLINSSWGGTRVEPWTPPVGFQNVKKLQTVYQSVMGRTPGTEKFKQGLAEHISATESWLKAAKSALPNESVVASPVFPASLVPFKNHQDPTMLYNGMIHPLVGYPIKGAIWYQGESNHSEGMMYFEKKKALINGWRKLWGQGPFPFYYVQIAPYRYSSEAHVLPEFWEAQAAVQQVANTGMVVINDIATVGNIHPPNKQDVGLRLANLALKNDYGRSKVIADSPEFESLEVHESQLKVAFKNTGGGLKTRDGEAPSHFEIIGAASGGFQPATGIIVGDTVVLSSAKVKAPVAFRFAWDKLAEPNLSGGSGLPVAAVRGGEIPEFFSSLPGNDKYKLVYDLDLSALSSEIVYDVDNSSTIQSFDRIGYLVELDSERGNQRVFVSMNSFTDDIKKIGIPTISSMADFQQSVTAMDIYSNVEGITTGTGISTGNIEFWPSNYGPQNSGKVKGASASVFDTGDSKGPPTDGYGSMQVHNHGAGQTIFAINHWKDGPQADIGIGNSSANTRDWTFVGNAASYSSKRLRIYVRPE